MDIKYERIVEVNNGVTYTNVKGKNYAEVSQKVQAFRNLIPGGFITSEIIKFDPGVVYMKAEAGYYENGQKVVLSTGHAFERQDASNVNKTSFIENCETSAVGRALAFIGIGSESSIASVEELTQAIATQNAIAQGKIPDPTTKPAQKPSKAEVTTAKTLPGATIPANAVLNYLAKERDNLKEARQITTEENTALWSQQVAILKQAGLVPNKALSTFTMQEAENLVQFMYTKFQPTGTELLTDDGQAS